jgi:hypothetical protein
MREWIVNIEGATDRADEDMADRLVEALAQYAPAVSFGHGRIGVTLSVEADTPGRAVDIAAQAFMSVVEAQATRVEAEIAA